MTEFGSWEDAADKNNVVKEQEFLYQILQFM